LRAFGLAGWADGLEAGIKSVEIVVDNAKYYSVFDVKIYRVVGSFS